ncbi:hypothetical protein INR49_032248 [Caranx melampygus]|nr:hypothetical protein INR49_032248 [Caranx melampygus]
MREAESVIIARVPGIGRINVPSEKPFITMSLQKSQQRRPTSATMSVLVQLLMVMIMTMKAASARVITVTVHSGHSVLLTSDQLRGVVESGWDIRWTHLPDLVLSLSKNMTRCHHGRCELLNDGSLKFSQVQADDSGNYSLEVFNQTGKVQVKTDFLLSVDDTSLQWPLTSLLLLVLLPLLFIVLFILRRRRMQRTMTTGPMERNVYVSMHRRHSNRRRRRRNRRKRKSLFMSLSTDRFHGNHQSNSR